MQMYLHFFTGYSSFCELCHFLLTGHNPELVSFIPIITKCLHKNKRNITLPSALPYFKWKLMHQIDTTRIYCPAHLILLR